MRRILLYIIIFNYLRLVCVYFILILFYAAGINIMRVLRDDKYIARMLEYARIFHSTFTMKKQAPPDNFAADLYPDYDAFLQDTKRTFGVFFL